MAGQNAPGAGTCECYGLKLDDHLFTFARPAPVDAVLYSEREAQLRTEWYRYREDTGTAAYCASHPGNR